MFSMTGVMHHIQQFADKREQDMVMICTRAGEVFANAARSTRTYQDRTKNLRGSIGFAVIVRGDAVITNTAGTPEGQTQSRQVIEDVKNPGENIELIGTAGMEYAAAVEALDYDVISGSVPLAEAEIKKFTE